MSEQANATERPVVAEVQPTVTDTTGETPRTPPPPYEEASQHGNSACTLPPYSMNLERNGHTAIPQAPIAANTGMAPLLTDGSRQLMTSSSISRCRASRDGCGPCTIASTISVFMIGFHAAMIAACTTTILMPTNRISLAGATIALLAIAILNILRYSSKFMKMMCLTFKLLQILACISALVIGLTRTEVKTELLRNKIPIDSNMHAFNIAYVTALVLSVVFGTPVFAYYISCAATGAPPHMIATFISASLGISLGIVTPLIRGNVWIAIGFGAAIMILGCLKDYGAKMRDTCHYKLARFAMMRTYADMGFGVAFQPASIPPNGDGLPRMHIGTHEEDVSIFDVLKRRKRHSCYTLFSILTIPFLYGVLTFPYGGTIPIIKLTETTALAVLLGHLVNVFILPHKTCSMAIYVERVLIITYILLQVISTILVTRGYEELIYSYVFSVSSQVALCILLLHRRCVGLMGLAFSVVARSMFALLFCSIALGLGITYVRRIYQMGY
ncbi:UL43 [anatid alphaherpesvirus 1]|nr:UL43 [Anatid alphaherpesvirus 1]